MDGSAAKNPSECSPEMKETQLEMERTSKTATGGNAGTRVRKN